VGRRTIVIIGGTGHALVENVPARFGGTIAVDLEIEDVTVDEDVVVEIRL